MKYTITIDQEFAIVNDMTLTQVASLSACVSLMVWTKTVTIDGKVWYFYSEDYMAAEFPLLFGIPKRCYKNLKDLEDAGFIELTKIGKDKYLSFTEKCAEWGREKKVRNRTNSPKVDEKESENGLISPHTPLNKVNNNINNHNTRDKDIAAESGGLFPGPQPEEKKVERKRGTTEALCLFEDSRYNDFETFAACFKGAEYEQIDLAYYYGAVSDWSAKRGKKMKDWIATARGFMRSDMEQKKLHTKRQEAADDDFDMESFKRYLEM